MNTSELRGRELSRHPSPRAGTRWARLCIPHLSIKQRLPLLIGGLLLGVISASTWASYQGVKDSALEVGNERLRHLTQQLAEMFQQSANNIAGKTVAAANDPAIRAYLRSPATTSRSSVETVLQQFKCEQDPNCLRIELWNTQRSLVLALPESSSDIPVALDSEFSHCASGSPFSIVGAYRVVADTIVHPVV